MITHAERFRMAFDEALGAAVAAVDTDDEAEARDQVAAAVRTAHTAGVQALVTAALVEARQRAAEADRVVRQRERAAAERKRLERDAPKALRKKFGGELASRVELFTQYTVVRLDDGESVDGVAIAVPRALLVGLREQMRKRFQRGYEEAGSAIGWQLGTIADRLDAVAADIGEVVEVVASVEAKVRERTDQERARKAEEAAALRKAAEAKRLYGTTIDA
jgi:hypothetical protein